MILISHPGNRQPFPFIFIVLCSSSFHFLKTSFDPIEYTFFPFYALPFFHIPQVHHSFYAIFLLYPSSPSVILFLLIRVLVHIAHPPWSFLLSPCLRSGSKLL